MGPRAVAILLVAAALPLPGCCTFARWLCPVEQALRPDTRLTRDTPAEALDYLVAAFRDRRIGDIYDSLHPEFRERHGDFSQAEFTSAFEEYEDLFREDAEQLEQAERTPAQISRDGTYGAIAVRDGDMAAVLWFKRRDVAYVKLDDEILPESRAVIPPLGTLLGNEGGWVGPRQAVRFDGLDGVDPAAIVRLEYRQEWLVYDLRDVRGVRFMERLEERF